jgi:asparagine synthase (glutamine-hydrolysing)
MVEGFDQPFGNPTAILVYILSQLTRQHVTVALAGDGGDELFGGYPRYRGLVWLQRYRFLPQVIRRMLAAGAARLLRDRLDGRHTYRRVREFLQGGRHSPLRGYLEWIGYWDGYCKPNLYSEAFVSQLGDADEGRWLSSMAARLPKTDLLASASALDLTTFLPENLLTYTDRMSMAHSLEVRVPFTDHVLIEKVLPLRATIKWPRGRLKGLLRGAIADQVPQGTLNRAKLGFNPPMAAWLRGHLAPLVDQYLSPVSIRKRGIFRVESVETLKTLLRSGTRDVALHVWALIVLECWMRKCID